MSWLRFVFSIVGNAFMRMLGFGLEGGISNACAGAVLGAVLAVAVDVVLLIVYVASFFVSVSVPSNLPFLMLWFIFIGVVGGAFVGGIVGASAMSVSGLVSAFSPCPDLKAYFHRSYQGLLWSSTISLFAGVGGAVLLYFVLPRLHIGITFNSDEWLACWVYGSYQIGALAPGLSLWMLHRMGEVYGRVCRLVRP